MSKLSQLQERRSKRVANHDALITKTFQTLRSRTSKRIGCKNCGSQIAKDMLNYLPCPVCGDLLASDTVKGRLNKLKAEVVELEKGIQELGGTFS